MSANGDLLVGREALKAAKPRKRRAVKAPQPSEGQVVTSIINALKLYGCTCQVNPNEAMSRMAGRGMKILHTILGFPDLTVMSRDGRTAYLEVKAPGAKPRNAKDVLHWQRQADCRDMLTRMGHVAAQVRSIDDARDVLRAAGWRL